MTRDGRAAARSSMLFTVRARLVTLLRRQLTQYIHTKKSSLTKANEIAASHTAQRRRRPRTDAVADHTDVGGRRRRPAPESRKTKPDRGR